jgi:hypothetical protein
MQMADHSNRFHEALVKLRARHHREQTARHATLAGVARGRGQGALAEAQTGSLIPRILWQFLIHLKITSEEGLQRVKPVQRHLSPFAFGGGIFLVQ